MSEAGVLGFEPRNGETKTRCLTAWRHPNLLTFCIIAEVVGVLSRGLGKKFLLFVVGCWLLVVRCWLFPEIPCGIALWAVLYQSSIIEKGQHSQNLRKQPRNRE